MGSLRISSKILISFVIIAVTTLGLVGFLSYTIGVNTLEREAFNKLTAVREMKSSQIEEYFQFISDQILTFSEDKMIIDAMHAFADTHATIFPELDLSESTLAEWENTLTEYYRDEFLSRLRPNLEAGRNVLLRDYYPQELETIVLQSLFIGNNPNPTGSKDLLDFPGDGSRYSAAHEIYHPIIRDYLHAFGYYDIFLVDVNSGGHIVYSVFKEVDFGTSLLDGPYADTNFGRVYQAALEADREDFVMLVDFEPYHPSYNAPAAFIASPIFDGDEKIGVLIFQMPIDRINNIMTNNQNWEKVGLGQSGETYIVAEDFLLRNQSRFLIEDRENYFKTIEDLGTPESIINQIKNINSTIGLQKVETQGTTAALGGLTGVDVFPDYRGVPVFSAYKPLNIEGVTWVMMSEKDEAEVYLPIRELQRNLGLGILGLFALIVLVGILFSRTLTRPIIALNRSATDLAEGNLDNVVSVTTQDEIGDLANSFEVMRLSMKDLIMDLEDINKNLEQKVEERTKEVEQATERIRTIVEIAPDAVITIDSQQTITMFNPKAEEIFGYSAEEVLGQPLTFLMPDKSRSLHPSEVAKFQQESTSARNMDARREIMGQRKDGTIFPAEAGISKMVIDDEVYFTTFFRDITERKELEAQILKKTEELALAEKKSTSIIETAGEGIIVVDQNSSVILWNQAAEKMFGYTKEEILGENLKNIIPEQYLSSHDSAMEAATEKGHLAHPGETHELSGIKKDGVEFPLELTVSQWEIAGVVYYSGILKDITERKKLEERIKKSEERLKFALEGSNDGLWDWMIQADEVYFSPRWETMLGYEPGEIEPKIGSWEKMVNPEYLPPVNKIMEDHLTGKTPIYEAEYPIRSKTGEWVWILARGKVAEFDVEGKPVRFVGTHVDITERKDLERQLEIANERMSDELNFAKEIQMSMLPLIFPAFPTRAEFNIYAHLIPAREVGGDFYDFYFLDESHLCFVIGDVSGKGAPGALLMAVSKTLIKSRAMDDFQPSSILTHVNNELSQNNDSAMFVTVFIAVLEINTGRLVYCNAGHNPPYIHRGSGEIEKLDDFHGPVIGALPNLTYKESSLTLRPNDIITLHTDGVTEAMNRDEIPYSDERYEKFLQTEGLNTPQKLIDQVIRDVKLYESGAEQADDITMVSLQYHGASDVQETGRLELKVKNQIDELARVEEQFEAFCEQYQVPDPARQKVSIVLDELLNNVVNYAFTDEKEHLIDVNFVLTGHRLVITIHDDGVPFNPFELDPPDISLSLDERVIGGLGIFLVRQMMDEYLYTRHIGKNVVRLVKLIDRE